MIKIIPRISIRIRRLRDIGKSWQNIFIFDSLVLGIFSSYTNYDGLYVLYLDKNTMKYRSTTVIDPNIYRTTIPIKNGDCIKKSLFPKVKRVGGMGSTKK